MQHLQGAPKTASVGEPRPRLCLLRSWLCRRRRWRWITCRDLLVQRLQVVVLTICAGRVTFGNPVNLGCLGFVVGREKNSLVSRFDKGHTGRGYRDGRTAPTESCHNHLCNCTIVHIFKLLLKHNGDMYLSLVIVSISKVMDNIDT